MCENVFISIPSTNRQFLPLTKFVYACMRHIREDIDVAYGLKGNLVYRFSGRSVDCTHARRKLDSGLGWIDFSPFR